jgi:transcriptional regulator with XRE-family HTH domain
MPDLVRSRSPAQELADHVVVARARKGLSQAELAERAGISRDTLSRIERGEADPTLNVLSRLADALSVDVAELLARDRGDALADDDELVRRAADIRAGNVDARTLLVAIDDAAGHAPERYSRAGRPRVAR